MCRPHAAPPLPRPPFQVQIPPLPQPFTSVFNPTSVPPASNNGPLPIRESKADHSSSAVSLTGPLKIYGKVHSSSSITLANRIYVDGKVQSSSFVKLDNEVEVNGKVEASAKIWLRNGVRVTDKVSASGAIEYVPSHPVPSLTYLPSLPLKIMNLVNQN